MDATSLFTNIPTALCTKAIKNRWQKIKPHIFLTQKQFLETVNIKDEFYLQKAGLAMDNSISGFLADMVMKDLETNALQTLPFHVPSYKRYVDDIIVEIPENQSNVILDIFNKQHKKLKFAVEEEIDQSINFLDLTLNRTTNGDIVTSWYQKAIASGRYLHFNAHNPMTHKRNVATTLTDRAIAFTHPKTDLRASRKSKSSWLIMVTRENSLME